MFSCHSLINKGSAIYLKYDQSTFNLASDVKTIYKLKRSISSDHSIKFLNNISIISGLLIYKSPHVYRIFARSDPDEVS